MVKENKKMAKMARTAKQVKSDILKNGGTEQNGGSNSLEGGSKSPSSFSFLKRCCSFQASAEKEINSEQGGRIKMEHWQNIHVSHKIHHFSNIIRLTHRKL